MSFSAADFAALKWSLGAFALSIGIAAGAITYGEHYLRDAAQQRQTAQKALTEARNQLATAQNDRENMATYQMEYDALQAQKVIGNEARLDWIEGLEKLRQQGLAADFKYTIAPQQPYAPNPPLDAGNFALNISPMTLQIDLLHEEQLLALLSALHTRIEGWFLLDHCNLTAAEPTNKQARLLAECGGGWITLKNRNAP